MAGMIPENFGDVSTQTIAFRDTVMGNIVDCPDKEAVLRTLLQQISATEKVATNWEVAYCEYAASIALLLNEVELFKEILLRVEPTSVSSMIKTLYDSVVVNKTLTPEKYSLVIRQSASRSRATWESQKQYVKF